MTPYETVYLLLGALVLAFACGALAWAEVVTTRREKAEEDQSHPATAGQNGEDRLR